VIQNQCFSIPPDDPRAVEVFDLIGLQGVIMSQQNDEAALVNAGGDRTKFDRFDAAMRLVNKKLEEIITEFRLERGGDETCRAGLTYVRGYPVVTGRSTAPPLH